LGGGDGATGGGDVDNGGGDAAVTDAGSAKLCTVQHCDGDV